MKSAYKLREEKLRLEQVCEEKKDRVRES